MFKMHKLNNIFDDYSTSPFFGSLTMQNNYHRSAYGLFMILNLSHLARHTTIITIHLLDHPESQSLIDCRIGHISTTLEVALPSLAVGLFRHRLEQQLAYSFALL
jgi:hypothetical protein